MRSSCHVLIGLAFFTLPAGCAKDTKSEPAASQDQRESPAVAAPAKAEAEPASKARAPMGGLGESPATPLRGVVRETMDSGGYTYLHVDTQSGLIWAAAKKITVSVGDKVSLAGITPMRNFHSRTLDRTFDELFLAGVAVVEGGDAKAATTQASASGLPTGHPLIGPADVAPKPGSTTPPEAGEIVALPDGQTVAGVIAGKKELAGKSVRIRGKVVKANRGIMGRNWLHIRDGTGEPGSNDLTVTTHAYAPPGTVVVVVGTVAIDRDFGAGYKYEVIIEDAKITTEPTTKGEPAAGPRIPSRSRDQPSDG